MTPPPALRIGTRASLLARTQTDWVAARLREFGVAVTIQTITTVGDEQGDRPVPAIGGDGVFVRELEAALLDGRIDAAVHSLKDLPTAETAGLTLACVPPRALPFDVLVSRHAGLAALPPGAVVGTSSVRRHMLVRSLRPDVVVRGVRGNVDSRLGRLDEGAYDALVLAGAGLERLGLEARITEVLEPPGFWPAVAQGALVVQTRAADAAALAAVAPLDHAATRAAVAAERSFLAALAGGCLAPIGGWARHDPEGGLVLGGCVLEDRDGVVHAITAEATAAPDDLPETLGRAVAGSLRASGADAMLAAARGAKPAPGKPG
ncbi:MAG: hydroxymethylbilane synthase [Planctomycetia bacterium]|nr:hydroxymethylbilane synthase [Planctomycetia bacterium]